MSVRRLTISLIEDSPRKNPNCFIGAAFLRINSIINTATTNCVKSSWGALLHVLNQVSSVLGYKICSNQVICPWTKQFHFFCRMGSHFPTNVQTVSHFPHWNNDDEMIITVNAQPVPCTDVTTCELNNLHGQCVESIFPHTRGGHFAGPLFYKDLLWVWG